MGVVPGLVIDVKIKGVIFSTLIDEVWTAVPYSPSNPQTSSFPGQYSQTHHPAPFSLPPSTLMHASGR